jgi:hypothetical protein
LDLLPSRVTNVQDRNASYVEQAFFNLLMRISVYGTLDKQAHSDRWMIEETLSFQELSPKSAQTRKAIRIWHVQWIPSAKAPDYRL